MDGLTPAQKQELVERLIVAVSAMTGILGSSKLTPPPTTLKSTLNTAIVPLLALVHPTPSGGPEGFLVKLRQMLEQAMGLGSIPEDSIGHESIAEVQLLCFESKEEQTLFDFYMAEADIPLAIIEPMFKAKYPGVSSIEAFAQYVASVRRLFAEKMILERRGMLETMELLK